MLTAFQMFLALTLAHVEPSEIPDQTSGSDETAVSQDNTPDEIEVVEESQDIHEAGVDISETEEAEVSIEASQTPDRAGEVPAEPSALVEMPLGLGVIEEAYNFVNAFHNSRTSNVEAASANAQDSAGGVKKAALFEHPRAEGDSRIEYELKLPQVDANESLALHFSIGLRDGVDFDYPLTKPDGVRFAIEISREREPLAERRFEGFSMACKWDEHIMDVSDFAGRQIKVAFLTNCNDAGNTNYDWALWGNPRILRLTRVSLPTEKGEAEPRMICGLAIGLLKGESPKPLAIEFAFDVYKPVSAIANEMGQRMQIHAEAMGHGMSLVELALYTEQPRLEIMTVGTTVALVTTGEDFDLQCTVRNNGLVPLEVLHEASVSINRIKLQRGRSVQPIKKLNPGEETALTWNIRSFSREVEVLIPVSLRYQTPKGEIRQTVEKAVQMRAGLPKLSTPISQELHTYDLEGHVITENKNLRAVFVRGSRGFEYYVLFVAKNGYYRQVAVCNAISEIRYRDSKGNVQEARILPAIYRLAGNNRGDSIVLLSWETTDDDGVHWSYEGQFALSEESKRLQVEYRLVTDGKRELIAFTGPMLYAGEGAFGENKTFALFPGVEFLEDDEPSSNSRDAAPPIHNRLVPHPYKITIPLMAVEHRRSLVGLVWNPLETWDGEHNMLSAVFASPNWHEHQQNHLMGLFLPTPPDWVDENSLEASRPYILEANRPITLKAQIIVDGNASIWDAISHWTDAYGMPDALEAPRPDEEELLLSRHGFMHTVWDEGAKKSRHCVGWSPGNAPGFATLLWYDYLATQDEAVKQRVLDIAESTIRESGAGGLISPALCHILKWEFPFYFGHVEAGLEQLKTVMRGTIDAQESDGSWRFHPTTERTKTLGKEGDAVLGTSAHSALMLLKYARITGDPETLEAGLKALKFMERFNVPRGAQAWECPLYEPDILAAAYAVGAYIEAYVITNDRRYLDRAEYWAGTGLPFLYYWNLPDRPGMRFASIPVFGTTFYTHSWFGVPVQWNGLVYAYYLQHLARYSRQQPWAQIAEGITVSAMYQQWTEGDLKGTYPDGFYGFCTEGRGPHINPEDIMVNLYTLRGLDPDISTAIVRYQNGRIHLSSGAKIESVNHDDSGRLTFKLRYVQHETSYSIISGYGGKPSAIRARNEDIPPVDNLDGVESGWLYREEKNIVFIKNLHPTGEMDFEVLPPSKEEAAEAKVEAEPSPKEEGGKEAGQ